MCNNTLKQAQADVEAMDMLKDGLIQETNNDTKEWNEDILEHLDHDITVLLDKYIAKYYLSEDGYLFFEDDKILDKFDFALNIIQSLIKDTYNKPLTKRKEEYQKSGLESTTCPTCDQYPYSDTDDMCPVCAKPIKER